MNGGGPGDWVSGMFGDVCRYSFASCVVVYARENMGREIDHRRWADPFDNV